jgi:hypothetical protein
MLYTFGFGVFLAALAFAWVSWHINRRQQAKPRSRPQSEFTGWKNWSDFKLDNWLR